MYEHVLRFPCVVLNPVFNVVDFLSRFTSWSSLHASPLPLIGRIPLSLLLQMEDSEQEEQQEEESEEFNIIPPYLEKDSKLESRARESKRGAAGRAAPMLPLLMLPMLILHWEFWSYWSYLHHILCLYLLLLPLSEAIAADMDIWRKLLFYIFKTLCFLYHNPVSAIAASSRVKWYQQSCSICHVFAKSCPMKWREQHEQICECMGEFRNAVWANTLSRACFTVKVHPLFKREAHHPRLHTLYTHPKHHIQSTPLQPDQSTAFDFYFMIPVIRFSLSPLGSSFLSLMLWLSNIVHFATS